jgi:hypothetical protein
MMTPRTTVQGYKMMAARDNDLRQGWRHQLAQGLQGRFELASVHHVHGGRA